MIFSFLISCKNTEIFRALKTPFCCKPGKYERELIKKLLRLEQIIRQAASDMNPAVIAHYIYDVAKAYNAFYQNVPILQASEEERNFRLALSALTANVIKNGLNLLGIEVPERM